eukprot:TRINITY_DN15310_c0_g1_i1.p1 TRINITY_DN15310_c0_g1~~TRINITY_DN15310_c0_g1_i1.p1  ORF type:complete len:863 (-),score=151.51 TRINITY_DN15310_c0_g1_i1:60-2648(-)
MSDGNADSAKPVPVVGQRVVVAGLSGIVRFTGQADFAVGDWVGIELDERAGRNDGEIQGKRYFECPEDHGIFVRPTVVRITDESTGGASGAAKLKASEAASSDSDCDDVPEPAARPTRAKRRLGVSAEDSHEVQKDAETWAPPVYAKSPEERTQLCEIIRTSQDTKLQMMFGNIPEDTCDKVIDAMFMKKVPGGDTVMAEGDVGDNFYIVKSGNFDILKNARDEASGEIKSIKVFQASQGFAFGELALLYNAPRSATIVAAVDSEVWCLERLSFRNLVVRSAQQKFDQCLAFIRQCEIFQELNEDQRASLAEVLEEEEFDTDEAILEQGEKDDKMYILRKGKAVACIQGDQGEVEVMRYSEGDYFGEIALLLGEPRKASVYAETDKTECLYIGRDTFNRVLGPLQSFLERNIEKYQKYQEAVTGANQQEPIEKSVTLSAAGTEEMEVFEGGSTKKNKLVTRKRERSSTQGVDSMAKTENTKDATPTGPEPTSLAEKIAQDFSVDALVKPCDTFVLPNAHFQIFGGLRLGEKFADDKVCVARGKTSSTTDGLDDIYTWSQSSKLKGATSISVICQKGQKSASDPTPNQDNYFALHVGDYGLYGVCDGHGPFGHLVSFRLVQTLPHIVTNSSHFGKDWKACLTESFASAQQDLLSFCDHHKINVEASGAAGSVLVYDGVAVHVAHIGDASVMLGSWNRRDTRLIFGTEDHKPQNPAEKARLEFAGSEVRMVDEESARIYLPGSSFPGLSMSRAFGDTACAGVLQEPEYKQFFLQPQTDEWYVVLASDGIWEFMPFDKVLELSAKKLRLKGPRETVKFLLEASRKRWSHCCGDYCDDITVLLVQWNAPQQQGGSANHSLTVTRPC